MSNIYETLVERWIIAQCTNEEKVKEILNNYGMKNIGERIKIGKLKAEFELSSK